MLVCNMYFNGFLKGFPESHEKNNIIHGNVECKNVR